MMTKFMNKQRGLLAAIMALVMVFAGAAFIAAEVDAGVSNTDVAKIGDTGYATLQLATEAATSGDEIILLKSIEYELVAWTLEPYMVLSKKPVVINGDGHTLTIKNNAKMWYIMFDVELKDLTLETTDCSQIVISDDKTLKLNNVTFERTNGIQYITNEGNSTTSSSGKLLVENSDLTGTKVKAYGQTNKMTIEASNGTKNIDINLVEGDYSVGVDLKTDSTSSFGIVKVYNNDTKLTVPAGQTLRAEQVVNSPNGQGFEVEGTFTPVEVTVTSINDVVTMINNGGCPIIDTKEELTLETPIVLKAGQTLTIKNATILAKNNATITVEANANLILESADVRVPVIEKDGSYISVTKAKKMTVTGDSTADLGVGYGNTLVLADLTVPAGKKIQAWGTVVIEGNVTVQKGAEFDVYQGGDAKIDGTLNIEGIALVDGVADINGTVKVYYTEGDAEFTVGQTGEVNVLGTMDILKPKTKGADNNVLTVSQNGDLDVEGTLTVTGKLVGKVCDMGTVVFNGVADNATIAVFDGVTLTIAAVDGKLTLTDDGIVDTTDMNYDYMLSDGNTVTIEDVKNVTVSVEVIETVKDKVRYIYTNMDVSGVITDVEENENEDSPIDAKIKIENEAIREGSKKDKVEWTENDKWPSTIPMCAITIGDVTLGKDTQLNIDAVNATVEGTVNVVADGSSIITPKVVDVEGTIIVAGDDVNLKVNGAMYIVDDITDDKDPITYYTTFENAIAAVATALDNEVTILGEVEVATALEIPAEATVLVKGALTIDVDGKITVAVDAVFNADNVTENVDIDGMLVIMDKEYGLVGENNLTYQVYTETETTATYSGLVLAIQNAVAGDVITLKQDADITKSVTIPEGVTLVVPNNVDLFIGDDKDKVTLTVAGKLEVQNGGEVKKANGAAETTIVIPGVVTMSNDDAVIVDKMTDYVEFTMKVDGKDVHVHSNLAYAAENAVNRDVTIKGDVSGGDVTFTYDGKIQALAIKVPVNSTLTVGTLTIVGDGASIQAVQATTGSNDEDGTITGTIATAAGSVDLNKVSGITLTVIIEEDVDGTTDVVTIAGEPVGSVDIASGIVTAATGFKMNADEDNKMSVASGATLVIDSTNVAINGTKADKVYAIVDGTISIVKGGIATISYTTVNGNVDVASAGQLTVGTDSVITGTITVAEKTDDAVAGIANIASNIFVGTAPAIGATGTLVGPFTTADADNDTSNVIIAYPGSDLTGALIDVGTDGKSAAKSTEFYINGQLYMTAITAEGIAINTFANGLGIEIPGLDTPKNEAGTADEIKWFTDEALKTPVTDSTKIGDSEKLYAEFAASEVDLVVSAGVGLKVYIDGLDASEMDDITVGTHTVSFAVESGYDGSAATITVNGVQVSNNGTFIVDVDADKITIIASGAVPAQSGSTVVVDEDDGMALTDILLIVLVVLIVIMAIIVALRMMRS